MSGDAKKGKELYNASCWGCHNSDGGGNLHLVAPNLKILDNDYFQLQLTGFKNGWRGKEADRNIGAMWMRTISNHVEGKQNLDDIMTYLQTLR